MRLFVAVELSERVREAAANAARELQRRLESSMHPKWVAAENMHLTVRFIGHVPDERVPPVLEAVRPPLALAPFQLTLDRCGVFPPSGPPRVVWIGFSSGRSALQTMHEELTSRLLPLGFRAETRPFTAHLTLARIKDARRGAGAIAREAVREVSPSAAGCLISHATVFESHLSPQGSRYTPLFPIPLTA
jgi:2'-5' RNA ligase